MPYGGVLTSNTWNLVASGTYSAIPFDTKIFTSGPGVWGLADPTKLKITYGGVYLVSAKVEFEYYNGGGSNRGIFIRRNGSIYAEECRYERVSANVDNAQMLQINSILQMTVGEYLELVVHQDSPDSLYVYPGSPYGPILSALRIQA